MQHRQTATPPWPDPDKIQSPYSKSTTGIVLTQADDLTDTSAQRDYQTKSILIYNIMNWQRNFVDNRIARNLSVH